MDTGKGLEELGDGLGVKLSSGITVSVAGATQSGSGEGSFMQSTLGYVFGNNVVGVSWYGSSDYEAKRGEGDDAPMVMGDGTALGIGFLHDMPAARVNLVASVQQYSADLADGSEEDDLVAIIGTRVLF